MNRRGAAVAGHTGDEATARALVDHADAVVRATARRALLRMGALTPSDVAAALDDPAPRARADACALAAHTGGHDDGLVVLLGDRSDEVAEAAAWALGERGDAVRGSSATTALSGMATSHTEALCREAAVAALGAIGDPAGLPAILDATTDKATVRRRAVIALAPFEGADVDEALQRATTDRDWQVRQAAEDLLQT